NEVATAALAQSSDMAGFQPEAMNATPQIEDAMTMDMPALSDMPERSEPWTNGLESGAAGVGQTDGNGNELGLMPAIEPVDDEPLPIMDPQEAAVEISALAGLTLDGEDLPEEPA
ncbi:MAG: hypothetical protein AB3N11_05900, partial [Arenibacterium sp.]